MTLQRSLLALALAWLAAVAAIQLLGLGVTPAEVGSSPDALVSGHVWRMLSSSLIVDDDLPLVQLALLAAATAAVLLRYGAVVWWVAALVGHVGSALLTYALLGAAIALGSGSAERTADDWDYGISCVFSAQLGVLCAGGVRRLREGRGDWLDVAAVATTAGALVVFLTDLDWYGTEHFFALALGGTVAVLSDRGR
ncbi:hypothetical protein [Conexibacter woesei]|uniref:Peptidase S54 rhomboid domain-containing protein n=1 Tax=Conexibacter woesei (strain DSM 14684 / CCUG 47730 / CIP 108061 / JCM 11494 / NBRC 100937 / ID131577) TaxID=469383 RepID=D3F8H7_CONWI|nr:hypothetical protein [Conexibacter woesei]ADB50941.1 hypothetical protein Cwoe_2519 [Conexibacter woesei DSM 14684]